MVLTVTPRITNSFSMMINSKLSTTILSVFAVSLMICCNSGSAQNKAADTKYPESDFKVRKCYFGVLEKDSVLLNASMKGDSITGTLDYKLYEQDNSNGVFRGKMYGDTLRVLYTFVSEGMESVSEVTFLKKDSLLISGYGPMKESDGKMVFADYKDVKFDGLALREVGCK